MRQTLENKIENSPVKCEEWTALGIEVLELIKE